MGGEEALPGRLQTTTITSLREQKGVIDQLVLLSHDPGIYLVQVKIRGSFYRVIDPEGANLVFRSQMAAKKALEGLNVVQAVLEHQSSYDEMIGQGRREQSNRLQVPIALFSND